MVPFFVCGLKLPKIAFNFMASPLGVMLKKAFRSQRFMYRLEIWHRGWHRQVAQQIIFL